MLLCMKRTAVTLLVSFTLCSMQLHAQQVSFSGSAVQAESFFSSVSKQTGYVFFYNSAMFSHVPPLSVQLKNVSLDSAIHVVLKDLPFTYDIQGKTVFISPLKVSSKEILATNGSGFQKIIGRVIDQSGLSVPGASIYSTNSKTSSFTRENGNFQIRIQKGDSLTISCIGYNKVVIKPDSNFAVVIMQYNASPMDQVVVGGNLFATKRRSDISSLTIIDSKTLETLPVTDISEIYRGLVPGTNSFSYGDQPQEYPGLTIRGATSENSLGEISVYVDGVEWAGGSGYLSTLNKENIDRIEILRGPESSTLYGTGSNGGIVQIFTKKAVPGENVLYATAGAGFIESKWVPSSAFQQYFTLDKPFSFKNTSVLAGGTYQSNGPWLPGGGEKTGTAHLNIKWDPGNKMSVVLAGYYAGTDRNLSRSPLYDTCTHLSDSLLQYYGIAPTKLTNKKTEINSYFAGLNFIYQASAKWTHHLTAGFSQNDNHQSALATINKNGLPPDNFYYATNRTTTVRYSNILNLGNPEKHWTANITSGAEYKNLFYVSGVNGNLPGYTSNDPPNTNVGLFAQINASFKNVYLTAGLRYDYNKLFEDNHSLNPRIGLTSNFSLSTLIIKPRISWGSGITAPSYNDRYGMPSDGYSITIPNPYIKPQQQSGFDYGLEIYDQRNRFSGEVVYYDNVLKNMFAINTLPPDSGGLNVYQHTNIGEVANRGWEFSARYRFSGRLSVYSTFSIMHSVIKDSTDDYLSTQLLGQAPGYQLKYLPRHTAGLFVTYYFFKILRKKDKASLSLNITEVDGVYGLDGVRWLIDIAYGRAPAFNGTIPAHYFVTNGTVFRMGFHFEYNITDALRFFAQGSNILNQNNVEETSSDLSQGGSWLFGFKFSTRK